MSNATKNAAITAALAAGMIAAGGAAVAGQLDQPSVAVRSTDMAVSAVWAPVLAAFGVPAREPWSAAPWPSATPSSAG